MKRANMLFSALLLAPAILAASPPPAVRLKLSDEYVRSGDREKVRVESATDGYLIVLRMDTQGNMRVIFPADPTDDSYIRGDHEVEVRSRGDREAFVVNETQGSGLVFAAVSDRPFNFDAFSRGDHWDYQVLAAQNGSRDPEAAMQDIADQMTDGHYNYDLVSYTVGNQVVRGPVYAGWYGPWYPTHYGVWVVGRPYHYFAPRIGFGLSIRVGPRYYDRSVGRYYYMRGARRYYDRVDSRPVYVGRTQVRQPERNSHPEHRDARPEHGGQPKHDNGGQPNHGNGGQPDHGNGHADRTAGRRR